MFVKSMKEVRKSVLNWKEFTAQEHLSQTRFEESGNHHSRVQCKLIMAHQHVLLRHPTQPFLVSTNQKAI